MIFDKAANLDLYAGVHRHMPAVIEFVKKFLAEPGPDGRYEIDGDEVYVNVFGKPNGPDAEKRFETHDKYIDLQLVISGGQTIYWAARDTLTLTEPCPPGKDVAFYAEVPGTRCELRAGDFLFLFPGDAHRPDCELAGEPDCRKMVVKIRV